MRASEALMIGSLQLKAMPYTVDDGNGSGCAIGMINLANGHDTFYELVETYPWLNDLVILPCRCTRQTTAHAGMVHLFNDHVCKGIFSEYTPFLEFPNADKWTLEQLADWLESVDPTPKTTDEEKREAVEIYCDSLVAQ